MSTDLKEALLYDKLSDETVRCNICQRRCEIRPDRFGYCYTRINKRGRLYSLIYSKVSSFWISPVEKKPLFHFYPGSSWLSLGTLGCNFRCPGCQNWTIAHARMDLNQPGPEEITPEESIALAKSKNCKGISWTYNEPTIWFEYTLDGAKLAKENGLLTHYVTNGFMTPEALDMIGPYLDAFRVDVKGFSRKLYKDMCHVHDFRGILDVTRRAKEKWDMWIEIVTNVTPGYNDDEDQLKDIASWIKDDLGEFTPWHVTQFVPHLKLSHIPATPVSTLEKARKIGLKEGLKYVYLGNIWGHPAENTYCHYCQRPLIERNGFSISRYEIKDGKCPYCRTSIPGRFNSIGGNDR
ncbi:MAG: AmmeMemoRadiSam system radical SAM enzyme [candidate division Zixibacteria bacterium]|nr:AmmeMemoRadiSam system radical SAM enzyme [candidate division Zixibacteria bacterium]